MNRRTVGGGVCAAAVIALAAANFANAKDADSHAKVERLVAEALRAELTGNSAQRRVLLSEAIDAAPDYLPARWQSGQVIVGDQWLPVDKAQQAAAADPKRAEYIALRKSGGDSLAGQLNLARWCRKNGFCEEAKFHWRSVLVLDPDDEEALRALGARWYGGQLMSHAEIQHAKAANRERTAAAKAFAPRMAHWERLLTAGDLKSRDVALGEIRDLRETAAIPALEQITLERELESNSEFERCLWISEALLPALDSMAAPEATQSLIRHALQSPLASVRTAAIASLKKRPLHDYAPLLLSCLSMPIESTCRVATGADGSVHYWHSLYREGPDANVSVEARRSAMQIDLKGVGYAKITDRDNEIWAIPAREDPALQWKMAAVAAQNQSRFAAEAVASERQLSQVNRSIDISNQAIVSVLHATTEQRFGNDPRAWWDWWRDHNEYYSEGGTPEYEYRYTDTDYRYYREPGYIGRYTSDGQPAMSCFAAGTPVWTNTGKRQIETLKIGDLVLAQDPDTGELAYKPVIGRTVRPPSPIVALRVGKNEIQTTLGHPFWVAGIGWRMAKELGEDASLHGINGPVHIDAISQAEEAEAYNLVVADFATYFVGETGVLVHDNTPRRPTSAQLPGLARP